MAIATPSTVRQGLTGDVLIDAAITGFKWNLDGSRTIDWSISDGFDDEFWADPSSVRTHIEAALGVFSYYTNVRFNFVGYFADPSAAAAAGSEINVSMSTTGALFSSNNVWGMGLFPSTSFNSAYAGAPGDLFLNISSQANTLTTYAPGSAGWFLILHELGHTLGLKHPHDNGGQPGRPTLTELGLGDLDTDWWSIMSYDDAFNWNLAQFDPATPMLADVLALQYLYGSNLTTNAGNDTFLLSRDGFYRTIWDAAGRDTISAQNSDRGWEIYLPDEQLSTLVPHRGGYAYPLDEAGLSAPLNLYWFLGDYENAIGSNFADDIYGNPFGNLIHGLGGDDFIIGWTGDDGIQGGAGNDYIDGGEGLDLANYDGASANFAWWRTADGLWHVQDLRSGSPEGLDELDAVETLGFTDRLIKIAGATVSEQLGYAFENILRYQATKPADVSYLNGLAASVSGGAKSLQQAYGDIAQLADGTTAVAAMTYQFFVGYVPSKGGFDYLIDPGGPNATNINSAYYQSFNQTNRYINFAVNVGSAGDGKTAFQAEFGSLSLRESTRKAYAEIFGNAPGEAKLDALLNADVGGGMTRADYFAFYGRDGLTGLGTKAAMVGWLLSAAATEDQGYFARSTAAYLVDLADGAQFLVDIIGTYSRPEWAFGG